MRNIFHQLRWKLTLSYTLVTVCAFLVVMFIIGGIVFVQIFVPADLLTPEGLVETVLENSDILFSELLSESPVDTDKIDFLLRHSYSGITGRDFLRIGAVQFNVRTVASFKALLIGPDGILLGRSEPSYLPTIKIGEPFDISRVPGLEAPFTAALAGEIDPKLLNTVRRPTIIPSEMIDRFTMAIPIFDRVGDENKKVLGVLVYIVDAFPTQRDIPANILSVAGRSLFFILLGAGIVGGVFGAIFANGMTRRFNRLSTATDAWSEGDFSKYIVDNRGDEISQFAQRLNNMAKQLQNLLRRRQDMAVSEERNRLARDLHDSAKQQALAASFELGTAITLFERDPEEAKKHLAEADILVDSVRRELTNLVQELRPQPMEGQDFSEGLKDYAIDWSHRSEIALNIDFAGNGDLSSELSIEVRETLFRIAQEALANIARHSSASRVDMILEYAPKTVTLMIRDNGCGFDTSAQSSGLGLHSMRERAEAISGSFGVESGPGLGAKIVVTLPKEV